MREVTIVFREDGAAAEVAAPEPYSDRPARVRSRRRVPIPVAVALGWLSVVILASIFANVLPISNPDLNVGAGIRTPPLHVASQFLGTDSFGRSILSRLIYGARVSLVAGFGASLVAMTLGLLVGVAAGYFRGSIDTAIGILVDSLLAIPGLILLIALAATLQPGLSTVVIGLAVISFPAFARLARGNTLLYCSAEFVLAARGLGATARTVIWREILPLVLRAVAAYAGVVCALLILAESALSFLGLGVPPPQPSWGNMISDGQDYLQSAPFLVFIPIIALFLTVLALNAVGDWLHHRSGTASKLSRSI
jgi:peptide/nickel transport system permease protein